MPENRERAPVKAPVPQEISPSQAENSISGQGNGRLSLEELIDPPAPVPQPSPEELAAERRRNPLAWFSLPELLAAGIAHLSQYPQATREISDQASEQAEGILDATWDEQDSWQRRQERAARTTGGTDAYSRFVSGASFILDAPAVVAALWGQGSEVLWAKGQSLLLCAPDGVGKTTTAQRIVRARLGLDAGKLFGFPLEPSPLPVLYLAGDRPAQAQASFARMCSESDRAVLGERLIVWEGPPPFDFGDKPDELLGMARHVGAGTVVLDSLKDVCMDLSKEEAGMRYNRARQLALANGVELLELHHPRKETSDNRTPNKLSDVYGSRWITAGAGSVVMLWGEAGATTFEVMHLKPIRDKLESLRVLHDHRHGELTLSDVDAVLIAAATNATDGITNIEAAQILYGEAEPSDAQIKRAARKLQSMQQHFDIDKGTPGKGGKPTRYRAKPIPRLSFLPE